LQGVSREPSSRPMINRRTWRNLLYTAWDVAWIKSDFLFSSFRSKFSLLLQGCTYGADFATSGICSFKARKASSIRIGDGVRLLADWRSNRVGLSTPVQLQTFDGGDIQIGDYSGGSGIVLSSRTRITIGKHVNLGGNVRIYDHDFHSLDPERRRLRLDEQGADIRSAPITIGDDVFVGANAMILKGVTIGDRSIVAAGAIVFRGTYPSDCMLIGNPASMVARNPKTL